MMTGGGPVPIMFLRHAPVALLLSLVMIDPFPTLAAPATQPSPDVLATLRQGHPRIWVTPQRLAPLRDSVRHGLGRDYFRTIERAGHAALNDPPAERVLIGPRLLGVSRATLAKVRMWAGLYLVNGDKQFADRAIRELRTVAAFGDWNPSHFLDTAEMTAACAIGYDWLYDVMSEDDRAVIRAAIIEKGLTPGVEAYREKKIRWTRATNNWAQVCAGGLTMGALAIADEDPDLAREVIGFARDALKVPMQVFAPDGGFSEGPGYWNYATQYTVYYLAALETALGNDFGYASAEGLSETGLFRIHTIGPSGLTFNYADAGAGSGPAPQMLWMARRFDRPVYAAHERLLAGGNVEFLHLLWLDPRGDAATVQALPPSALFRGVNVATLRTGWGDDAVFLAIKGGDNRASHAHLDLGTFVLDVGRTRWVCDPGPDNYNLPGYFGKLRWTYYHLGTVGQNTLRIGGANQVLDAKAPVTSFNPGKGAMIDLAAAYAPMAKVTRAVRISHEGVTVEDAVTAEAEPVDVEWAVHTEADVKIDASGTSAELSRGKERLYVSVSSPAGARLEAQPVAPPPPQRSHPQMTRLVVRPPGKVTSTRIIVQFNRERVAP